MSLGYEPFSGPLHIPAKTLFLDWVGVRDVLVQPVDGCQRLQKVIATGHELGTQIAWYRCETSGRAPICSCRSASSSFRSGRRRSGPPEPCSTFGVWGSGFGVQDLGVRVWGLGCRV